jgi:hypothetical protein
LCVGVDIEIAAAPPARRGAAPRRGGQNVPGYAPPSTRKFCPVM